MTAWHTHLADGSIASAPVSYDETNSIDGAPFLYRATVTINPSLLTTPDTFAARMLNPAQPSFNDVGVYFPYTLVTCP